MMEIDSPSECSGIRQPVPAESGANLDLAPLRTVLEKVSENQNIIESLSLAVENLESQVRDLRTKAEERRLLASLAHLVNLEDSICEIARVPEGTPDVSPEPVDWQARVALIHDLTREALGRAGLTPIAPSPGDPFDSKRHDAVGVARSALPDDHLRIAILHRPGYEIAGHLLRLASVTVFRNEAPEEDNHE